MRRPSVWLSALALAAGLACVVLVVAGYLALRPQTGAEPGTATTDRSAPPVVADEPTGPDRGRPLRPVERSQESIQDSAREVSPDAFARLAIPRLGVEAPVHEVGMSMDPADPKYRILSPPADPGTVGWWKGGPAPGAARGSVILIGHTKKVPGVEGVGDGALGHISRLGAGDRIGVEVDGRTIGYRVTEVVADMDFAAVAEKAGSIYDPDYPGGRLVLVTCWYDGDEFTGNTFVYAEPA